MTQLKKGNFQNFLAKKIDNALFTVNYEAAMNIKGIALNIARPDLLAYTNTQMFAIEAKGFSAKTVSDNEMIKHKKQSATGKISVNFTVASVSYNLYEKVKCKYYDPHNDNILYDKELFTQLSKKYYSGFVDFLEFGHQEKTKYNDEEFYEIDISYPYLTDKYQDRFFRFHCFCDEIKLILPKDIKKYAKEGLNSDTKPFLYDNNENIYIDKDRIGLKINK